MGVKLGGGAPVIQGRAATRMGLEGSMANIKLRVSGMTCEHCQAKVARALKETAGVYSAVVDLRAGEAEVDFEDDAVTTTQLLAAVEKAGYGAKLAG